MALTRESAMGSYHVSLRTWGTPIQIEVFHAILETCESSWPFKAQGISLPGFYRSDSCSFRVCDVCMGAIVYSPSIGPADIRAAARQAGIHVKVDRFCKDDACIPNGTNYCPTSGISQAEARRLCQHKAKKIRIEAGWVLVGNETVEKRRRMLGSATDNDPDEDVTKVHPGGGQVIVLPKVETVH